MRPQPTLALLLCVSTLAALNSSAQAPSVPLPTNLEAVTTRPATAQSLPAPTGTDPVVTPPAAPVLVVRTGRVLTAAGPLPGAVIRIVNSKEMVVTDADGSFHVALPAAVGPVKATAHYAGFADEAIALGDSPTEVRMTTPQLIKVGKKQQLASYLKTARKQGRKTMRRLRR